MRILLISAPYQTVTNTWGAGHQIPLGLLSVGGPLIDAGHDVALLDAELLRLTDTQIAAAAGRFGPDAVMIGHAGSTPADPVCRRVLRAVKAAHPGVITVYGGVHPTFHAADILAAEPAVDVIVRGEGEATAAALVAALAGRRPLETVDGIAFRDGGGRAVLTGPAAPIRDLDACRVAWELIEDWDRYQCFGFGRAAVIQFSRGCPHRCSYCGQHDFWVRWRHRDPARLAAEIGRLHRVHGIRFFDFADENPAASRDAWRRLLEAIAALDLPIRLFATIRAGDIVRDADLLPLYRRAGMICILMGIESTDPETLKRIRKGSTPRDDHRAIRLLRRHGILSMAGHIVGFEEETFGTYRRALQQLLLYDPDLLNAMYATPHRWTPWAGENADRPVIQPDPQKWDYRHQVLGVRALRPWQVFLSVKLMEAAVHLRPRALWRLLAHPDRETRRVMRWCFRRSALVFLAEIAEFAGATRFARAPVPLAEHFGRSAIETGTMPAGPGTTPPVCPGGDGAGRWPAGPDRRADGGTGARRHAAARPLRTGSSSRQEPVRPLSPPVCDQMAQPGNDAESRTES